MVYQPELRIFHKESASSSEVISGKRQTGKKQIQKKRTEKNQTKMKRTEMKQTEMKQTEMKRILYLKRMKDAAKAIYWKAKTELK